MICREVLRYLTLIVWVNTLRGGVHGFCGTGHVGRNALEWNGHSTLRLDVYPKTAHFTLSNYRIE
ncbi:hypothetical protein SQ11_07985 [Nitrosospira sp. NpAV]|nr:hypothetical protein SQ11_07985 [Nitrosospira sp. NpAV]